MKNSLRRLSTQGMKFLTTGIFTFYVVCMMANAQEASPWISLNGGEAHPTRILARLNNHNTSTLITADVRSALQESGSVVSRQYPGIPGLVLLDVAVNHNAPRAGYRPGVNKEQQAEDLQARMDVLKQSGFFQYVEPNFIRRISKDAEDQHT
jgi:hypothetical protein